LTLINGLLRNKLLALAKTSLLALAKAVSLHLIYPLTEVNGNEKKSFLGSFLEMFAVFGDGLKAA